MREVLSSAKAELIEIMKLEGEVSVKSAAAEMNLADTTVRQHLAELEGKGLVQTRRDRRGRGRPRKMYRLTDKARPFFQNNCAEFLTGLIETLKENGQTALLEKYIDRIYDEMAEDITSARRASDDPLEALFLVLERQGFVPTLERTQDSPKLVLHHCPFADVAESTSYMCEAELSYFEQALDQTIERTRHIEDGDLACEYCICDTDTSN